MDKNVVTVLDLFNNEACNLPCFVTTSNVVYVCENKINGKKYVGETKMCLYDRWSSKGNLSHKSTYEHGGENRLLYKAFYKYGLENFLVSILESGFENDADRKASEIYWINELKTYSKLPDSMGYNMTIGGDTGVQLQTIDSHRKAIESNRKNHNGRLAYNTKESHDKAIETLKKKNGGVLPFNKKEAQKKAKITNRKRHGGKLAIQTEESRKKSRETQLEKYGCLFIHTEECRQKGFDTQRKRYGCLAMNLPENIEKMKVESALGRIIGNIERHIEFLRSKDIAITPRNYVFAVWDTKRMWQQHIPNVLNKLTELRKNKKWTQEMENIFSKIAFDETKPGVSKIIFLDDVR